MVKDMNEVVVRGRLCADPTINYTKEQKPIANMCLAIPDRERRLDDGSYACDFIRAVVFNPKQAEIVEQWLVKGSEVLVKGKLSSGEYVNNDNQKIYTVEIIVQNLEFIGSLKDDSKDTKKKK